MGLVKTGGCTLIMAGLLMACRNPASQPIATEADAIFVADAYVTKEYPEIDRTVIKPIVTDHGKYWLVKYEPPEDHAGGGPELVLEKRTRRVVAAFRDQ